MKVLHEFVRSPAFRVLALVLLSFSVNTFAQQPHTLTGDIRAHKASTQTLSIMIVT